MNEENELRHIRPVRLIKVHHEAEAGIIMSALAARGIESNSTGDYTAGLRAESPGMIQIWVHEEDRAEAHQVINSIKEDSAEIDWAKIDTGDRTPLSQEEMNQKQLPND